jgi:hypothetical protein
MPAERADNERREHDEHGDDEEAPVALTQATSEGSPVDQQGKGDQQRHSHCGANWKRRQDGEARLHVVRPARTRS